MAAGVGRVVSEASPSCEDGNFEIPGCRQNLQRSLSVSSTKPATCAVAVIEQPSSDHLAHWPLFAHYRQTGQCATHALALLAKNWDEAVQEPLPSARTARHWARVDGWDRKIEEAIAASVVRYHASVDMQLLRSGVRAVDTLNRVRNGEFTDPRLA